MVKLTKKQIKRNVLRFMGFDLPNYMLDNAHDFKVEGDKIKFKTKAKINPKDWKFSYGSCQ